MGVDLVGATANPITIYGKAIEGLVTMILNTNRRSVTLFYGGAKLYVIGGRP